MLVVTLLIFQFYHRPIETRQSRDLQAFMGAFQFYHRPIETAGYATEYEVRA